VLLTGDSDASLTYLIRDIPASLPRGKARLINFPDSMILEAMGYWMQTPTAVRRIALRFLLIAALTAAARAADIPWSWTGVDRIVAVGDLHGDYENFVRILRGTRLVDAKLAWIGGKAHFVQTGDVMDRGTGAKAIFDLIRRLEADAAKAGGMVHFLIGNHEELNFTGMALDYPGYVPVEQFVAFLPRRYRREKEREFMRTVRSGPGRPSATALSEKLAEFWQSAMKTPAARKAYCDGFIEGYGSWLLGKNAVIRINDTIFVHGGISKDYSTWKIEEINARLRNELGIFLDRSKNPPIRPETIEFTIVFDPNGPLWFRGLALRDDPAIRGEFDRILGNLGAARMVIAHSFFRKNGRSLVVSPGFMSRFNERLWVIDTGISDFYGGVNSALIIEKGEALLWTDTESDSLPPAAGSEKSPLPETAADLEAFLRTARVGTIIRGAPQGRTDPWTIVLIDGETSRKAVFKYINRSRPAAIPHSYKYELAAHALCRLLGLDIVPPIVEREIEGVKGSLQIFVDGAITEADRRREGRESPDAAAFANRMDLIRIFALLVNDACENPEDTLIDLPTGRIYRVDFAEAFGPESELRPRCPLLRVPEDIIKKLRTLDDGVLKKELSRFLNGKELSALIERKSRLIRLLEDTDRSPR
jgi:hypothetical protein